MTTPTLIMVDPHDVIPTTDNKRRFKKNASFQELVESVKADGIQQPPLCRPHPKQPGKYDLRFGERRRHAVIEAGLALMPILLRDMDDHEAQRMTLIENDQREDLTPLEQADSYQNLLDQDWTIDQLANELGKSPSWVARRAQLTKLSPVWRDGIGDDNDGLPAWSASHYEVIASLPGELQEQLVAEFKNYGSRLNAMTVKELRENVARYTRFLSAAKWKLDDASMPCGACLGCLTRTDAQPLLFDDQPEAAGKKLSKTVQCLDPKCWGAKETEMLRRAAVKLQEQHETVLYLGDAKNTLDVTTVKEEWNLDKVKKGEPGALPALRVSKSYNGDVGEVIWVKPRAGTKAAAKVEGAGKTLEEKRAGLEKARIKIVAVKAAETIAQADHSDFEEDGILALLYIFGTSHSVTSTYHYDSLTHQQDGLDLRARRVETQPHGQILKMLFPTIQHNAVAFARSIANQDKPDVDGLKLCCSLWHVDYTALWAAACDERKEPASWAAQEKPAKKGKGVERPKAAKKLKKAKTSADGFDEIVEAEAEALALPEAKARRGRKGKAMEV